MQRLLTEDEYQELVQRGNKAVEDQRQLLNKLCMQVANATMISYTHLEEKLPHGCVHNNDLIQDKLDESGLICDSLEWDILEETLEILNPLQDHCDNCPVLEVCTLTHSYSK